MTAKRLIGVLGRWLGRTHWRTGSCGTGRDARRNRGGSFDRFTVCSFCGKQQDRVQRLIAGPGGAYVCDECVAVLSHSPEAPQEEQGLRCSFCGKHQRQVLYLAIGPRGVNICQACLVLCGEIIAKEELHQR